MSEIKNPEEKIKQKLDSLRPENLIDKEKYEEKRRLERETLKKLFDVSAPESEKQQ